MIPKIIHYCWFGGNPLPESAEKCIASWRKFLPDYEIKEWNESNFDVNIIPYTAEAYKAKKYAFVSDYARFYILYKCGGLYFDTDVEVIRNMDDIIARGPFMGCEGEAKQPTDGSRDKSTTLGVALGLGVNPGLGLGVSPGLSLYKEILDIYEKKHFLNSNGLPTADETVVTITTGLLCKRGMQCTNEIQDVDGIWIYPKEYFCPKDYATGQLNITKNSRTIHHYDATWLTWEQRMEKKFWNFLGLKPHRVMWHIDRWIEKLKYKFTK